MGTRSDQLNKSPQVIDDTLIRRLVASPSLQIEKEHRWLPRLAPSLPLQIPTPLAIGEPSNGFPWKWGVYRWIDGDTVAPERINDLNEFASSLAEFLIDPTHGPPAGPHNFYRGGSLQNYDARCGFMAT